MITTTTLDLSVPIELSSLDQYLSEIGQYPLLSREREQELAAKSFQWLQEQGEKTPDLCEQGQAAYWQLVVCNLRLVVPIAHKYVGKMDLLDLIQHGNLGLFRAAKTFDPAKGTKFSTYATYWIIQAVSRAVLDYGSAIRLPVNLHSRLQRLRRAEQEISQEPGSSPVPTQLAEQTGTSPESLAFLQYVQAYLAPAPKSLDRPLDDEEGSSTLGMLLPEQADADYDQHLDRQTLLRHLAVALQQLSARERQIVLWRYGVGTQHDPATLEEIGERLGVCRERIRQLEKSALKKLHAMLLEHAPHGLDE